MNLFLKTGGILLVLLISLQSCGILGSKSTSEITKGETNAKDYLDTFKVSQWGTVNDAFVKEVRNGKMEDSIEITFLDNNVKLKPGQSFVPEYFSPGYVNPTSDFSKAFINSKGEKVRLKYKNETYYGILEFNYVYKACAGDPSARSYYIKVPKSNLETVKGGNISVVYEYYQCAPRQDKIYADIRDYTRRNNKYTSWVLWISDIEFE